MTKNLNGLQGFDLAFTREGSLWKLTAKKGNITLTATALDRATAIWQAASQYERLKKSLAEPRLRLLPIFTYGLYLFAVTIIALTFIIFMEWPR